MKLSPYLQKLRYQYEQNESMRLSDEMLKKIYGEHWQVETRKNKSNDFNPRDIDSGRSLIYHQSSIPKKRR